MSEWCGEVLSRTRTKYRAAHGNDKTANANKLQMRTKPAKIVTGDVLAGTPRSNNERYEKLQKLTNSYEGLKSS